MENFGLLLEQANSGDAISQYKVGRAYESGDGVEKNINTAIMWYQKAADNGYKNANAKLQLLSIKKDSEAPKTAYQAPAAPEAPKTTYQAPAAPKISTAANTQSNTGNSKTSAQIHKRYINLSNAIAKGNKILIKTFFDNFKAFWEIHR